MVHVPKSITLTIFAVCVAVMITLSSARSVYQQVQGRRQVCSRHMACRWAICPWSLKRVPFPDEENCLIINNDACECGGDRSCTLTDLMEPGTSQVKYEYRCIGPELTRDIYQLGRRSAAK